MAVAHFGRWVDNRLNEKVERDAPKVKRAKVQVPKYKTLAAALGIDIDPDESEKAGFSEEELDDIRGKVEDFRRDPKALAEFLKVAES